MELMDRNFQEEERYKAAKKQIKEIKGFYIHLLVYLFVNIAIIAMNTNFTKFGNFGIEITNFYTAFFWGIGLFAHWASVFGAGFFLGKRWEEKKINELLEKDREQQKKWE